MRSTLVALLLTIALPLLGGCGQIGPLYMPQVEAPQEKPAAQTDNSQEQTDAP